VRTAIRDLLGMAVAELVDTVALVGSVGLYSEEALAGLASCLSKYVPRVIRLVKALATVLEKADKLVDACRRCLQTVIAILQSAGVIPVAD
jgi:hypothetical protein